MTRRRILGAIVGAVVLLAPSAPRPSQAAPLPSASAVVERVGERIPPGLVLHDELGRPFALDHALGGPPLLVQLGWYRCTTLCGLLQERTARALRDAGLVPGRDVLPIAVSFDPHDNGASARSRRARTVTAYDSPLTLASWPFLIGDGDTVRRLADRLGVGFAWDEVAQQFAHAAVLVVLTGDGRISSYVYGAAPSGEVLADALARARRGEVGSADPPLLARCIQSVAALRRWDGALDGALRAGSALAVLSMAGGIAWAVRARRRGGGGR